MKRKSKHIFFVQSDFHYMICRSIIKENGLKEADCYFVCKRGIQVEKGIQTYPFPIDGGLKYYLLHRKEIDTFYKGCEVTTYTPFRFLFPKKKYIKDVVFFEEGLSSYRLKEEVIKELHANDKYKKLKKNIKYLLRPIIMSLVNKYSRGFVAGLFDNNEISPLYQTTIYVCSPQAYEYWDHPLLNRNLLKIDVDKSEKYDVPKGSFFLVLERFSGNQTYTHDSYMRCVRAMIEYCVDHNMTEVWTKFHPADWNNKEKALQELNYCAKGFNVKFHFFDGHLEYLALQDDGLCFISISSTILYYAPILGKTNKSVSFVRYLYGIDDNFKKYIQLYGDIDRFVEFFSEEVECLNATNDFHLGK